MGSRVSGEYMLGVCTEDGGRVTEHYVRSNSPMKIKFNETTGNEGDDLWIINPKKTIKDVLTMTGI